MKKLLPILFCFSFLGFSQDVEFEWAGIMESIGLNSISMTHVDNQGNTFVMGYFEKPTDFDFNATSTLISTNNNSIDIFIAKYASDGSLVWAKSIGGPLNDFGFGFAVADDGSIYITGDFSGTVDFNPGSGTYNLTAVATNDAFLLKLNETGNFLWAKRFDGTNTTSGRQITIDASGNLMLIAVFSQTIDADPGSDVVSFTSNGSLNIVIIKIDPLGNYIWAKQLTATTLIICSKIIIGTDGSIYMAGYFIGTADFDPNAGTNTVTSIGDFDAFIAKYSSTGNLAWVKHLGGSWSDFISDMVLTNDGGILVGGSFGSTVDMDPGPGTNYVNSNGEADAFMLKLNSIGEFQWVHKFGSISDDWINGLVLDQNNNIYISGSFVETVDFDPSSSTAELISQGSYDGFVAKYTSSGDFIWVNGLHGNGLNVCGSIHLDQDNSIIVTGRTIYETDFDPSPNAYLLVDGGNYNAFLWKMNQTTDLGIAELNNEIHLYPNPFSNEVHLEFNGFDARKVDVINLQGQVCFTSQISGFSTILNLNNLAHGSYLLELSDSNGNKIQKTITKH